MSLSCDDLGALAELLRKLDGSEHHCRNAGEADRPACSPAYTMSANEREIARMRWVVEDAWRAALREETKP